MMSKAIFFAGIGAYLFSLPCIALQTYKLVDHEKTEVVIASNHYTRLAVAEDRIQQIFGAEGQFDIESDDEQGQVFLKPVSKGASKVFFLTIVTEKGLTQDLRLIPKAKDAQSILFKPSLLSPFPSADKKSRESQIAELLHAMIQCKALASYDQTPIIQSDRKISKEEKLNPVCLYQGDHWTGRVYTLTNLHDRPTQIVASHLAQPQDVAIFVAQTTLLPKQRTKVFIISKTGRRS